MNQKIAQKINFTSFFHGFISYESVKNKFISAYITVPAFILILSSEVAAQKTAKKPFSTYSRKGTGLGVVAADSLFSINFQFRMQNRVIYTSTSGTDLTPDKFEFRTRRMRMKFKGFVYNPKITYYFQLALSRADMDWVNNDNSNVNSSPNVIRDAVMYYTPNARWRFSFGQTKLPGNRQRVTSSGDQQFYDRSIVNAYFNIDRDFGFFGQYTLPRIVFKGALTSGEGRNATISDKGLAYTGRVELLPLGKFSSDVEVEGDLDREPEPKVSIASSYSYNDRAMRQQGQLGNDLYAARTLRTWAVDMVAKYNGWSWYSELMKRSTDDPHTINHDNPELIRTVYTGHGWMSQLSYLFKNNFEVATRYARVTPSSKLYNNPLHPTVNEKQTENYEAGVTQYIMAHRFKVQAGVIYTRLTDLSTNSFYRSYWTTALQVELGF